MPLGSKRKAEGKVGTLSKLTLFFCLLELIKRRNEGNDIYL